MSFLDISIGILIFAIIGVHANFELIPSLTASIILCTFLFFQPSEWLLRKYYESKQRGTKQV